MERLQQFVDRLEGTLFQRLLGPEPSVGSSTSHITVGDKDFESTPEQLQGLVDMFNNTAIDNDPTAINISTSKIEETCEQPLETLNLLRYGHQTER